MVSKGRVSRFVLSFTYIVFLPSPESSPNIGSSGSTDVITPLFSVGWTDFPIGTNVREEQY
jgi:hypothetical protein